MLFSNVSIVFHSAATVKFDEKLKLSVTINMLGTKRLVQLCHQMLQLDVRTHFIQISSQSPANQLPLLPRRPSSTYPRPTRTVIARRWAK